jgi:hypothetical protein
MTTQGIGSANDATLYGDHDHVQQVCEEFKVMQRVLILLIWFLQ